MSNRTRSPLIVVSAALLAALAMPAMAQDQQQAGPAQSPASAAAAAPPASSAASGGHQTWQSVDTDGDGAISKQEAQVNAGLASIFDQADSDADGKLTTDEYKAFVAKQQSGASSAPSQQQQ
jgi:hypothetical protein